MPHGSISPSTTNPPRRTPRRQKEAEQQQKAPKLINEAVPKEARTSCSCISSRPSSHYNHCTKLLFTENVSIRISWGGSGFYVPRQWPNHWHVTEGATEEVVAGFARVSFR